MVVVAGIKVEDTLHCVARTVWTVSLQVQAFSSTNHFSATAPYILTHDEIA